MKCSNYKSPTPTKVNNSQEKKKKKKQTESKEKKKQPNLAEGELYHLETRNREQIREPLEIQKPHRGQR